MIVPGHNNGSSIQVQFTESNRLGKFNLPDERIDHDAGMCQHLLKLCTVIMDEPHESGRGRFIMAASPLFDALAEGDEIPEYRIEAVCDAQFADEDKRLRAHKSGRYFFAAIRQILVRVPSVGIRAAVH